MMAITDEIHSPTDNDCQNYMPFILYFSSKNNLTTYIHVQYVQIHVVILLQHDILQTLHQINFSKF